MSLKELKKEFEVNKKSWEDELSNWSEKDLTFKKDEDSWSALQILEHLIVSEVGTLRYLTKKTKAPFQTIPPTLLQEEKNSAELNEALISDKKWKTPPVMPEPRGTKSVAEQVAKWNELRGKYDVFLKELPKEYYKLQIFKHPIAGRLNLKQTLEFLNKHLLHHKHQLNRLKKEL